jgi:hypothetical protein
MLLQPPYSFLTSTLLFHSTMFPYHPIDSSHNPFPPCCILMPPLSVTHLDSRSHEPSFPVLLPLVRARFSYLFKNVVTACISLTWIYSVLSDNLNSSSLGRRLALLTSNSSRSCGSLDDRILRESIARRSHASVGPDPEPPLLVLVIAFVGILHPSP